MTADPLPSFPVHQLGQYAVPHIPRPNNECPEVSDSNDEIMTSYEEWMQKLSNPKMWEDRRLRVKTTVGRMTTDHPNKMDIALSIWQPNQQCLFLCGHVAKKHPGGIKYYSSRVRFLRHLCEIHLPVLYEWDCPVGTCPLTFD